MFRNFKLISKMMFGRGCFSQLGDLLKDQRKSSKAVMVFLVDDVFENKPIKDSLPVESTDILIWVNVDDEPKTSTVDQLTTLIKKEMVARHDRVPSGVIGIGGGSTMDIAKAVSLMLTNPGSSSQYQGWDLITTPAVYHAAVPTLSGTGAEVSRTTVLTGPEKKLGINSNHTVFDQIVLDPELIEGAPNPQRFYTGMDCFIHCVESLEGTVLNTFSQSYAEKAMDLCRDVFLTNPGDADDKLMMASYCGGMCIAHSQVGICHALSYGLSFALGLHHGVGNCIVFDALEEYYPEHVRVFRQMIEKSEISLPRNIAADITEAQLETMVDASFDLSPLWEHSFGVDWKNVMSREKIQALYLTM